MKKIENFPKTNVIFGQIKESLSEFCELCVITPGKNFLESEPLAQELLKCAVKCSSAQFFLILQEEGKSKLSKEKREFILMVNEMINGSPDLNEYPFSMLVDGQLRQKSSVDSIDNDLKEFQSFIKNQVIKGLSIDNELQNPVASKLSLTEFRTNF